MRRPNSTWLSSAAALVAAAGFVLWLLPVRPATRSADSAVTRPAAPDPDASPATPVPRYDRIVADNPFASDRRAPATRYAPPSQTTDVAPAPAAPAPGPTLYGIATGPLGAVALIDADRTIPGAEIYHPGDRVGDFELQTVADTFVVLVGAAGTTVLRLNTPRGGSRVR